MRLAAFASGLFLAMTGLVFAQPYETPQDLLEAFYQPYFTGEFVDDESVFRSAGLQALYNGDASSTPVGEMGALSFDPYIDGQDYEITDLEIAEDGIAGALASVEVRFKNFGEPRTLTYDLVLEEGGWKIDDVTSLTPGSEYSLRQIFLEAEGL
ncbi:hypothetical protein VW29_08820 [Devosia limi DSM 17137]|uniref:DUF3828 domain-containing protein n=1 Tax=Devosia limi DSM 17137 TaxID=1121477 RepID=A0A0F5LRJ0_9HYPH|nr:DUF3828 domain-containing protein [Devosia limi]KKB84916.1 hypothetical protein VW29_08820 [Devosia limi DSM 17137]SHF05695.1 Protein of unknown function [Devosia limi DSM 17137]